MWSYSSFAHNIEDYYLIFAQNTFFSQFQSCTIKRICKRINNSCQGRKHCYLPHHDIYQASKQTWKVAVVLLQFREELVAVLRAGKIRWKLYIFVINLGATGNSICSQKNIIYVLFLSLPPPPLSKTWKCLWKFFTSHSVSMTCKLTPLPFSCSLALVIVQLQSVLNSLYFHTAKLTAFMITFWVQYAHIWEMITYLNCN